MGALRGAAILTGFAVLTLPLIPVQAVLVRFAPSLARRLPHWYHRRVCRLVGLRLAVEGDVVSGRPVLIVSNHSSWLDIPVLSAVAPVSFVAKREVGGWPGVGTLARLQRTVFVDRERRLKVADTASEIRQRLAGGDAVVLFAEGTSSDGNRVLPFRSSLFAAVIPNRAVSGGGALAAAIETGARAGGVNADGRDGAAVESGLDADVQAVALVYTRRNGLPLARHERAGIGWYGDMEMLGHAWEVLKSGPIDVVVRVAPPRRLAAFPDRKTLARDNEEAVRRELVAVLRGRPCDVAPAPTPSAQPPRVVSRTDGAATRRWT